MVETTARAGSDRAADNGDAGHDVDHGAGGGGAAPDERTSRDLAPFAHVHAPHSALYRDVMGAFGRAKERFTVHLRPEDVQADLDRVVDADALTGALNQLVGWGNLRSDPDTSRVTTVEDFHRARYLYQLTAAGEAAEQAIAVYERAMSRRAVLQSVALSDIATQLRSLLALVEEAITARVAPDAAKAHLLLISVTERFAGLADNAQAFMASLRRTVELADGDVEGFLAYKERLVTYIERFVADLANSGAEIAGLTHELERVGVAPLLELAARRDAADAAPGPEAFEQVAGAAYQEALRRWSDRWAGLRGWFVSTDARRVSQAKLLRSAAIVAITQLVNAAKAINERRAGRSDRSADFRTLARWFAQARSDEAAHRLWRVAFGLSSCRHLSVTTETLDSWAQQRPSSSTSWRDVEPVRISPQLRRSGSYERRGQPNRVIDRSEERALLAQRYADEVGQLAAARARLATTEPILLSKLGELDTVEFRLFLSLLGEALAARTPGATDVHTSSADGTMLVRLTVVPGAPPVTIRTAGGVLRGPEHIIEIVDMIPTAQPAPAPLPAPAAGSRATPLAGSTDVLAAHGVPEPGIAVEHVGEAALAVAR